MTADAGSLIRLVQVYAWGVFLLAWAQMGWVDWKEQKIRHHYLRIWLLFVLCGYLLLAGQSLLGEFGRIKVFIVRDYYVALLSHAGFSMAAAYLLWWLRIWPAGDVKLFVLLALCYPLMRVPGSFRSGLLFLEVLINIFVPAAAFLLLTAGAYLWRTRFVEYSDQAGRFLRARWRAFSLPGVRLPEVKAPSVSLPAVSAPDLSAAARRVRGAGAALLASGSGAGEGARKTLLAAWNKTVELLRPVGAELLTMAGAYRADPKAAVIDASSWLAMMSIMSMLSYYLKDVISSNVLKTLVCFALMFLWSRVCQLVGTGRALLGVLVACVAVLYRHPNVDVPELAVIFGHITVFSFFIFIGMQLAIKVLAGNTGFILLPFLMMLPGLVPWRWLFSTAWGWIASLFSAVRLPSLPGLPQVSLPAAPSMPAMPALPAVPALPSFGGVVLPAWVAAIDYSTFGVWALMGLLFGLSLVFVKIWDSESFKTVPIAHIERFMTLGPALVARIEEDEDFRDEHFSTFYADGLTGDQVEALQEWCREEGIDAVPLAPTISFGNWIFLGYFLTRLLEGHVLRFLY